MTTIIALANLHNTPPYKDSFQLKIKLHYCSFEKMIVFYLDENFAILMMPHNNFHNNNVNNFQESRTSDYTDLVFFFPVGILFFLYSRTM